ncbi:amino acid permease/ SLC12A domain-containing protein [Pseudomassariella vexata]|uniref:Amino acid permease/ SLC12A domain-containing protein n=1 Tax=Pseudomassariella vexata TaxID=1141098 RepID=A0A1Y2DHK8_9PEZI|nr:amino acid permease/ SLC12A domain-containing protein [Pseudomassariella vexata]ORY58729.1 amino acid permease/ SLC12A domain-containing protein [Pseudomassariella vexata]
MMDSQSTLTTDVNVATEKPVKKVEEKSAAAGDANNSPSINGPNHDIEAADTQLERGLKSYHLQFLAIGGTIGTGLFIGTGSALASGGPVGLLIAFLFVGSIVYSVMTSLGEMASFIPVAGSFTAYASRFVDPSVGFAMGWIYWFSWAITFAVELTAAGLIIQYWNASLSIGIFIAIFWVVFTALNFLPIRWFGEFEMYFSSIKVVTIIGFILFAICINAGVGDQGYLGFKYWVTPGPFVENMVPGAAGKFVGFWSVLITAGFSYQGAELVGIGAGETQDPAKAVPKAIRWTFWGILSLFVCTVFFIGILVPSDHPSLQSDSTDANASPLVIAANLAGVRVLPDIINAVLLSAVLSAANSNVYSGSRILLALSNENHIPSFMARTTSWGTPYYAAAMTSAMGLLAFLNLSENGVTVFDWLLNITAVAGFITWGLINICHLRFMKALKVHGMSRDDLPYKAPFQPYLAWYGVFFCVVILLTNGFTVFIEWSTSDFFAAYVSLILFLALFIGHKVVYRTKPVALANVDLHRGRVDL